MSAESVGKFLERVEADEQLQEELAQVIETAASTATEGADRQGATELGQKYGFDFSSEELWAEINKRQDQLKDRQGSGELSDDELEAVAGGGEIWIATIASTIGALIGKIKW
ncbi:Nif11-like leader peptide family natural product precursor [Chamaesiphon polymorphus]|jgi:predicted ribosomally synthesized peptide with nif11-like leader|uniref:Nif11-like leader peptide family natural product n=1 Tax=Chamaesiphon polymorphus CCALA 037 TaxID=2107692 RepID=A0A2T1GIT9_9CYAN|nr:Nif11-like leader peptide family natural product precursor [Chamaesiphon polymorphus]PSB57659.1 Nif11-like leader peptide family natural product precursor [Chamaesiphon polymorphus CCALA 037]